MAGHVGLRRGELVGLQWPDLELDAATLTVNRSRVQAGWGVIEGAPKSDASGRTIALDPGTLAVVRKHRERQAAERLAWSCAYHDRGYVFAVRWAARCTRPP